MQEYDGQTILHQKIIMPISYYGLYFKTIYECNNYFIELHDKGYIKAEFEKRFDFDDPLINSFSITFKGLDYYDLLLTTGSNSNNCFVAMSFSDDMIELRKTIKETIIELGFNPILIDEVHFESTQTINDAIIAEIKRCKFCVADFTEQKDGVYFESGFALGLGKQVIYTCHQDWFKKSHFDTNHFPHIIYNSDEELKKKLRNKINAWIN